MCGPRRRQPGFFTYVATWCRLPCETVRSRSLNLDKGEQPLFKPSKLLLLKSFRESSNALDILAHGLGFGLDLLHPIFHEIADGNNSTNPTTVDDRQMADSPLRHQRQS